MRLLWDDGVNNSKQVSTLFPTRHFFQASSSVNRSHQSTPDYKESTLLQPYENPAEVAIYGIQISKISRVTFRSFLGQYRLQCAGHITFSEKQCPLIRTCLNNRDHTKGYSVFCLSFLRFIR